MSALEESRLRSDPDAQPLWPAGAAAPGRRPLLALEPGTFDSPLRPAPWAELNVLHAALGGLAALAGRVAVLPVFNCSGAEGWLPTLPLSLALPPTLTLTLILALTLTPTLTLTLTL